MPSVEILARLQFAVTIMFHYLFPPLTIGLSLIMVVAEGCALWTKKQVFSETAHFWTKIFALNFVMGVVSGIVMEFQFGTNWAIYSRFVGDVFGSPLALEGLFAFFLESTFLGILIFGWDKVPPLMHFVSTFLVCIGGMFSAVWIVVANSWQQTPAGFKLVGEGNFQRAEITDFWAMVFNPSSVDRVIHVLLGSFILGAFFVLGVSAFYLLKKRHIEIAKSSFTIASCLALFGTVLIVVSGHSSARIVARYQPAKLAAMEAYFKQTGSGAPLAIFGIPDEKTETLHFGVSVPSLLSFLVHGDFESSVLALNDFPAEERPPVVVPFFAYRLMLGVGMAALGLSFLCLFGLRRGWVFKQRWLLWTLVLFIPLPYLANQAGWIAAEVGRQPWVVYGLLKTKDALSPAVNSTEVLISLVMFTLLYVILFFLWLYLTWAKVKMGPAYSNYQLVR